MADVRTVQKLLQEAEEAIAIINEEETLYNLEQTCYSEVEVIKESIEPYRKLFGLVLKWQRTEMRCDFTFCVCCGLIKKIPPVTLNPLFG